MCTLVHLKKYSFIFVEKYIKFSTSDRSYEKECFNCNVYFESNEATQETYVKPSQDHLTSLQPGSLLKGGLVTITPSLNDARAQLTITITRPIDAWHQL
eukprot:SAG11_NODE_63_length_18904_cov_11.842914_16_plen_99_part_00